MTERTTKCKWCNFILLRNKRRITSGFLYGLSV